MNILQEKRNLRKQMLDKRARITLEEKQIIDEYICNSIWNLIEKHQYKKVHCFLTMGTEINIFPLIQKMLDNGIFVVSSKTLPKRQLRHFVLESLDQLEKGMFGTFHPANTKEYKGVYDLILVPGLAFCEKYFRLGYGGGYYDNFIAQHTEAYTVGICYPFQKIKQIPKEDHDSQLDNVICS